MKIQTNNFPKYNLSEAGQSIPIKFASAKETKEGFIALHPLIKCRDYFNELLGHTLSGEEFAEVYGFKSEVEIPLDSLRLIIELPKNRVDSLLAGIDMLNVVEADAGIGTTIINGVETVEETSYIGITADRFWLSSTQHHAYFTLLLRTFSGYRGQYTAFSEWTKELNKPDVLGTKDREMITSVLNKLPLIKFINNTKGHTEELHQAFRDGIAKVEPANSGTAGQCHSSGGIITFQNYVDKEDFKLPPIIEPMASLLRRLFNE